MNELHPFETLLPPLRHALQRRALTLTSNQHRAEDLVQETFLKAWANRDRYQPDTLLRAWLFTILRNAFISGIRKHRREVQDVDGTYAAMMREEPRQDHVLALKELIGAIALLPEIQRRPLIMIGANGFSYQETADACGSTVGTIKSRVSRARSKLNRAFDDVKEFEGVKEKGTIYIPRRCINSLGEHAIDDRSAPHPRKGFR